MEKFNELFEKLNELNLIQHAGDWTDNIPHDIWDEYFQDNYKEIQYGINIDTHRWYETSITVIKIHGGLLGVRYITNMFSESSTIEDCYHTIEFSEMEEMRVTSYRCI